MRTKKVGMFIAVIALLSLSVSMFAQQVTGNSVAQGEELIVTLENYEANTWYVLFRQNPDESWDYVGCLLTSEQQSTQFGARPTEVGTYYVFVYQLHNFNPNNPPSNPSQGEKVDGYLLIEDL